VAETWCRRKKNYRTPDWKICAVRKKATAEHVSGKFCTVGKVELQNTWLENFGAVGKKQTAERMAGKCWCRRKKRTAKHVTGKFW